MGLIEFIMMKNLFGKSGGVGSTNSPVVIDALVNDHEAVIKFPGYDLSESLGYVLYKVSDAAPTYEDLSRHVFFGITRHDDLVQLISNTIVQENEEVTGLVTLAIDSTGDVRCVSISAEASMFFSELGIELPKGLYFTGLCFGRPSNAGSLLIYNHTSLLNGEVS